MARIDRIEKENIRFSMPYLKFNIKKILSAPEWRGIHSHSASELIYVGSGEIRCVVAGKEYNLKGGDIALIAGGVFHCLQTVSPAEITYVQFETEGFSKVPKEFENSCVFDFISGSVDETCIVQRREGELLNIFSDIKREVSEKKPFFDVYIKSYVMLLAGFMQRNGMIKSFDSASVSYLSVIKPILDYSEAHYGEKISLEDVAQMFGMSKYDLCRRFKKATGSTFVDYMNFLRLKKAENFLGNTEKNITEIALECGFSSVQYFNRVFNKYRGCSPKDYKKRSLSEF